MERRKLHTMTDEGVLDKIIYKGNILLIKLCSQSAP